MTQLQEIPEDESVGEDEDFGSLENTGSKIPFGLPGSKRPRRSFPGTVRNSRPESINLSNSESQPKRRGRPPGSTSARRKSNSVPNTNVENFWVGVAALGLNFTTALFAARIMHDPKYVMTKSEAEAAAKAIMVVAWKYKQFREFALIVNTDSDWAIIARGFWPYLSRLFMKELINYVMAGLFVGKSTIGQNGNGKSAAPSSEGRNVPTSEQSSGEFNGGRNGGVNSRNFDREFTPEFLGSTDWRDVG
jgi:hypothetical protein